MHLLQITRYKYSTMQLRENISNVSWKKIPDYQWCILTIVSGKYSEWFIYFSFIQKLYFKKLRIAYPTIILSVDHFGRC